MRSIVALLMLLMFAIVPVVAQSRADRDRAHVQNRLGWEEMRREAWEQAARSFQHAIDIDTNFAIAHYGLGRANMALKKFDAAIAAYERCRRIYSDQAGLRFANAQEAQRYRRDRLSEIDEHIRQVQSVPRPTAAQADMMRQLQNYRREIQESIERGNDVSISSSVPAYVSLALGSAYFRTGRLADAEREYKATLTADNRSGEAHSNLAVVYLETQRYADALAEINAAKRTGFKVNPELEKAIRAKQQ